MNELRGDARTVQDENRVGQDLRRLYKVNSSEKIVK